MKAYPIQFGKYLLLERVNIGGMAEVFKAKTFGVQGFERFVAIKRILPSMSEDDEFINMFVDEARIAVQLSHSNVVQIYELAKFENQYYIAMEFVGGKDMRQVLDRLREKGVTVPIPAAAYIASKICDGLDYAHRKQDPSGRPMNIIHRDVSPQNILVSYEGDVKITDFGIAKAEDRASKTQAGVLKGKFAYMSPEQVRGLPIDHRSDIFAVGILLYEMVTGERLFIGESDFSTLERVRNAEVPPPRMHNEAIPEVLESIMLKALARDREERYQWASELHDELQQFLIVDNSIFNAKRLAALVREQYVEEIEQERVRMEEFAALSAPKNMQAAEEPAPEPAAVSPQLPPLPSGGWNEPSDDDKTMIFEVGFYFPEAKTEIGQPISTEEPPASPPPKEPDIAPAAVTGEVSVLDAAQGGVKPQAHATGVVKPLASDAGARGPLLLVGATVLLCMVILAGVFLSSSNDGVGSIEVTSTPITDV